MAGPYQAAVIDYELPDLKGDRLAQLLTNVQPRLPIILFSGCVSHPARKRASRKRDAL